MAESPITPREKDFASWYQDVVLTGDLAEPAEIVKGCMVIKPNGYAVWELPRLHSLDNGHCHHVLCDFGINAKDPNNLFQCLIMCCMSSMTFLPKELRGAEKQAGTKFPANHIRAPRRLY